MANVKISALDAASTPLDGTEVLPIVQSGVTKKVSVDNLTAGKNVDVANLTATGDVSAHNLILQNNATTEDVTIRAPYGLATSYTLVLPNDAGVSGDSLVTDGSGVLSWSTSASGDVYGPASSTDNAVARFDLTTGKIIQNSVVTIGDTGNVSGVADLSISGTFSATNGVENTAIIQRIVAIADATSITINADTTDEATQANTQAVGTLTINAPTGTPVNGQKLILRISSANVQTFSWNSIFQGGTDLGLPLGTSGGGLTDYMGFIYNSTTSKWQIVGKVFGF